MIFTRPPYIITPAEPAVRAIDRDIIELNDTSELSGIEIRVMEAIAERWNFRSIYLYVMKH